MSNVDEGAQFLRASLRVAYSVTVVAFTSGDKGLGVSFEFLLVWME